MTDAAYLKAHDTGLEVMGRGTGVPESFKVLADWLESRLGEGVAPDKLLAALGQLLINQREAQSYQEQLRAKLRKASKDCTDLDSELRECREALAEWHARALKAQTALTAAHDALSPPRNPEESAALDAISESLK